MTKSKGEEQPSLASFVLKKVVQHHFVSKLLFFFFFLDNVSKLLNPAI